MPIKITPKQSKEDNERDARDTAVAGPSKAAKKRVVSKKELEASGKSLRDFLNEKQGLTRREPKTEYVPRTDSSGTYEERKVPRKRKSADFGVSKPEGMTDTGMGMKKGGKVESKLMGKEGRGMAKATMQKVASKVVKGHEKRMHKMNLGGSVSKRADGIAMKGKTKGRIV